MIAQVVGRLAAKQADRVMIHTTGGVGYEIVVPLGVMERLPAVGETVSLATELVVREDGWSLYGFHDEAGRRFFQRLIGVSGVGPKIALALMSALGVERGARAVKERNIALLASVRRSSGRASGVVTWVREGVLTPPYSPPAAPATAPVAHRLRARAACGT